MENKSVNQKLSELNDEINKIYEILSLNSKDVIKDRIDQIENKVEFMLSRLDKNIEKLNETYTTNIESNLDKISRIVNVKFNNIKNSEIILKDILTKDVEESAYLKAIFDKLTSDDYNVSLKTTYEIIQVLNHDI